MKELKPPQTKEEFKQLDERVDFNAEEDAYFNDMIKRIDAKYGEKDHQGRIESCLRELEAIKGKFGNRAAVERRIKYVIGHAYECLGTLSLEGHDPKERADMFEKAVLYYRAADEAAGFLTDYCLRQVEACAGAVHYRRQAGLEDEVTKGFSQRAGELLLAFFGPNRLVGVIGGKIPDSIKQKADEKIDGSADAYIFKDYTRDN